MVDNACRSAFGNRRRQSGVPKERSILVNVGLSFFIVTVAEIVYVDKRTLAAPLSHPQ
jgi:hypothetical protein